ncbi:MAG: prepilin-type N-terminal cleavage/methylation domain-containing protein, partial [Planctomycetota bacterium]|nr:prepilin-type N-terminal cleavage/methylation domain-containing protein [Planctomycetota bacterium]
MARRGRASGFTLIELLVVIGIITFMTALIIGVFLGVPKPAGAKATQKLLERIGIGLARYQADFRCLPPDTGFGLAMDTQKSGSTILYDPGSLYRYLAQEVVQRRADGTVVRVLWPYVRFSGSELRTYKDSVYPDTAQFTNKYVVDAWGTPIGYVGDPRRVIHNRGGWDLFSAGPDGKTACNDKVDNDEDGQADEANLAYDGAGKDDVSEMGEAKYNG